MRTRLRPVQFLAVFVGIVNGAAGLGRVTLKKHHNQQSQHEHEKIQPAELTVTDAIWRTGAIAPLVAVLCASGRTVFALGTLTEFVAAVHVVTSGSGLAFLV